VPAGAFKFAVVGDPQLTTDLQEPGWAATVDKIVSEGAYFIVSTGDHVDFVDGNELEYDKFFAPAGLRNLPFAPAVGNHDAHCLFAYHFNLPNEQNFKPLTCSSTGAEWSAANSGVGNYYYTYNRVLFIALNTSPYPDANSASNYISAFDAAIRAAKAANAGKYDWIIVQHHKSTQSVAIHASDTDIQSYVDAGFEKLMTKHGVDLVFAGHDHIFVRSKLLKQGDGDAHSVESKDNKGTIYVTVTTAGGLKYYPAFIALVNNQNYPYLADGSRGQTALAKGISNKQKWPLGMFNYSQNQLPEYTIVEVNGATMTVTTKTITGKLVDKFTANASN